MSAPGPKLEFVTATETEITVEFQAVKNIVTYELQWKPHPTNWESGLKSTTVDASDKSTVRATAIDLEPGATYCVRLACKDSVNAGEPGPELIIDTEQVGCTPQQKSCCTIS